MTEVRVEPSDWRPPPGVPHGVLWIQPIAVTTATGDAVDPEWVHCRGWWHPDVLEPDKEQVTVLVRFAALPEWAQRRLPRPQEDVDDRA